MCVESGSAGRGYTHDVLAGYHNKRDEPLCAPTCALACRVLCCLLQDRIAVPVHAHKRAADGALPIVQLNVHDAPKKRGHRSSWWRGREPASHLAGWLTGWLADSARARHSSGRGAPPLRLHVLVGLFCVGLCHTLLLLYISDHATASSSPISARCHRRRS